MEIIIAVTAFFLFLRLLVAFTNSMTAIHLPPGRINHEEKISILIPARNEALNIGNLLLDLVNQDYGHFEILVLDDASEDETAGIVRQFCEKESRCRLIAGKPLPGGWMGKNWACHQLAGEAVGDYFLFLDADVQITGPLFTNALSRLKEGKLTLLSLFPGQEMKSTGEWLVVPQMHYLLLSLLPLRFVEWISNPALSAANGQFMLFNAQDYRQAAYHFRVKNRVTEDIEIMKEVKRSGLRGATFLENKLIRCRMYRDLPDAMNGFSKNLLAGFGGHVYLLIAYVCLIFFSNLPVWIGGYWQLAVIMALVIVILRSLISAMAGQNLLRNILLHPFQLLVFIYIASRSIAGRYFSIVTWKGRKIKS